MKKYYPLNMDITNRECLVVGGGKVAERKIERLIAFEAQVRVVSPNITDRIRGLVKRKKVLYLATKFKKDVLEGADLVFAATSVTTVNRWIAREARKKRLWVNVAKPGGESSFILPALIIRKNLTVTVSTNGRFPGKSKEIKEALQAKL